MPSACSRLEIDTLPRAMAGVVGVDSTHAEREKPQCPSEANKILVRRLIEEVWNTGDYGLLAELATSDFAESNKQGNLRTRRLPDAAPPD